MDRHLLCRAGLRTMLVVVGALGGAEVCRAQTFQSSGVTLLSRRSLLDFPSQYRANSVWGYVSPSGKEYAIIGFTRGTGFVNVTIPTAPTMAGFIDHPGIDEIWREMKTHGHYAYVVTDNNGTGMQIINLANIDNNVVTLHSTTTLNNSMFTAHTIYINNQSNYLYLCATDSHRGLTAVNLANPTQPTFAGAWDVSALHDVTVVSYTHGPYAGREIAFGFAGSQGLKIIDVTNKDSMFLMATLRYPNVTYCHQGWLSEDRQYLFINDELDELQSPAVNTSTTYVVDIRDLDHPDYITSFTNGQTSIDHNLMIRGTLAFEANYTSGLRVYDVADPRQATEIAWFDTYPTNNSQSFAGAWGVYTMLPSRVVLVSDINFGLFVLKVDCNSNGTDDDLDVTNGTSQDQNGNGIPDECDGYVDCNGNFVTDSADIINGQSDDCNINLLPDECELADGTSFDCNGNAMLDQCELDLRYEAISPEYGPIGWDDAMPPVVYAQSHTFILPPIALSDVKLTVFGFGDFSGAIEKILVRLNGAYVGDALDEMLPRDCAVTPDEDEVIVPMELFNSLVGDGDAVIELFPNSPVSALQCGGNSFVKVGISYFGVDAAIDCNESTIPDECEGSDVDGDGVLTVNDLDRLGECLGGPCGTQPCAGFSYPDSCCGFHDMDADGDTDLRDVQIMQLGINLLVGFP